MTKLLLSSTLLLISALTLVGRTPSSAPDPGARPLTITVDASLVREPMDMGRYGVGQGGLSSDPIFDRHIQELRWLNTKLIRLFVQEYFAVYPRHGVYDWTKLDRAVETILKTGAKPLMSICIKPKALYPVINQDIVHPNSYPEWERLIAEMVRHYNVERKAGIKYWEIFNEPDIGEDGGCPGRFKPEDYVTYYEHTVRAIRRADPSAKVGGPALASWRSPLLKALLDHCSSKNIPLDFVSWHIYNNDPQAIRGTIDGVKALLKQYPSLRCETILDEWNVALSNTKLDPAYQPAYILETINQMREAGLDYCAYYQIRDYHVSVEEFAPFMSRQGTYFMAYWWNRMLQADGLFDFQGIMRPAYFSFKMLSRLTGNRLEVKTSDPNVKALAAWDPDYQTLQVLAWNFGVQPPPAARVTVRIANMQPKKRTLRRLTLDAVTASNQENDRLRPGMPVDVNGAEATESFDLPPYGVTLITVH